MNGLRLRGDREPNGPNWVNATKHSPPLLDGVVLRPLSPAGCGSGTLRHEIAIAGAGSGADWPHLGHAGQLELYRQQTESLADSDRRWGHRDLHTTSRLRNDAASPVMDSIGPERTVQYMAGTWPVQNVSAGRRM